MTVVYIVIGTILIGCGVSLIAYGVTRTTMTSLGTVNASELPIGRPITPDEAARSWIPLTQNN